MNLVVEVYFSNINDWDIRSIKSKLSNEEIQKINSIIHLKTQAQKIVCRFLLRSLLARKLEVEEMSLDFRYNERGKPFLKEHSSLNFNCSHSNDIVMIGLSKQLLGVDIEFRKSIENEDNLSCHFFNHEEYLALQETKLSDSNAFFKFWTAKESIIKALGKGVWEKESVPNILFHEGEIFLSSNQRRLENWTLFFPNVNADYQECIAVNAFCNPLFKIFTIRPHYRKKMSIYREPLH